MSGALPATVLMVLGAFHTTSGQDPCTALLRWSAPVKSIIVSSKMVAGTGGLSTFCEVAATITPVEGSRIGAIYRLPTDWNGKILGIGGGGAAGNLTTDAAADGLTRRYATVQNDMGHPGTGTRDWSFAVREPGLPNAEAIIDFGHRATHLATQVGKAVVARFYGKTAQHAYWQGCSTGGRQGLAEVQRYPDDYDGVIAGAPVHASEHYSTTVLRVQAFHRLPDSNLLADHVPVIQKAVLAACDRNDGVVDGILTDPRTCTWDPGELQCRGAASAACLTAQQVETVRRIYSGATTKDGRVTLLLLLRGGESDWVARMIGTPEAPRGINAMLGAAFVSYMVKHDPAYDIMAFDPERDLAAHNSSSTCRL